jgi:hypothetical protein
MFSEDFMRDFFGMKKKESGMPKNSAKTPMPETVPPKEELPDDLKQFESVKKYQEKIKLTIKTKHDKFYVETKFSRHGFYTTYKEWYEYSESEEAKEKPYGNLSMYEYVYIEFFDQIYDKEIEFICINYSNGTSTTFRRKDLLSFLVEEAT